MSGRHKPPPTAVQRAIAEGAKMGVRARVDTPPGGISSSSIILEAIEDEPSAPKGMSWEDRVEWRQQQHSSDVQELGRHIGAQSAELVEIRTSMKMLVDFAGKADAREEKREERTAKREDAREEREHAITKTKLSSREKVSLTLIAAIVTVATAIGGYVIGRTDDGNGNGGGRRHFPSASGSDGR